VAAFFTDIPAHSEFKAIEWALSRPVVPPARDERAQQPGVRAPVIREGQQQHFQRHRGMSDFGFGEVTRTGARNHSYGFLANDGKKLGHVAARPA
jgi:hypothetical protein